MPGLAIALMRNPLLRGCAARAQPGCQMVQREVLYVGRGQPLIPGYRAYLLARGAGETLQPAIPKFGRFPSPFITSPSGDIIRISPRSGEPVGHVPAGIRIQHHAANRAVQ